MNFKCIEEGCRFRQTVEADWIARFGAPRCPAHGVVMLPEEWEWHDWANNKLDLACGERKEPGFIGVDQNLYQGVDLVWNLDHYPYPFPDDGIDEIRCFHFIEHVENLVAFMEELYRIMRPGATGTLAAPFWSHVNTWRDPTHRRGIAEQTLMFFNRDYRERNKKGCYGIRADFDVGYSINLDPGIDPKKIPPAQLDFMKQYCVNVFFDITFTIRKR